MKTPGELEAKAVEINGETSDGYHTFNELYHHRAVLFSVIVKAFPDKAWKSKQHNDGTMYDGMFIVGIDTPEGQATYHYDIDPYWDMFKCHELARAPKWDGHTPAHQSGTDIRPRRRLNVSANQNLFGMGDGFIPQQRIAIGAELSTDTHAVHVIGQWAIILLVGVFFAQTAGREWNLKRGKYGRPNQKK